MTPHPVPPQPADPARELADRARGAIRLCLLAIGVLAAADLVMARDRLLPLYLLKLCALAVLAGGWWGLRALDPRRHRGIATGTAVILSVLVAASGVVRHDDSMIPLLLVVTCMLTAVLLPWGARAQAISAVAAALAVAGTVSLVHGTPAALLQYPAMALLVGFAGSVHVAGVHERARVRQRRTEAQREAYRQLLETIRRIQTRFIDHTEPRVLFGELLAELLAATGSEYGFIGEVRTDPDGTPYLKEYAATDISWNDEVREFVRRATPAGLEFRKLHSLYGAVITTGEAVIANDPATDPRRGGLPPGHPPLNAFLGLPLYHGGRFVGMVGVANRPGGYDRALVDHLEPLLTTCAGLVDAHVNLRRRQLAEAAQEEAARVSTALARVAQELASSLDTPVVLDRLCQLSADVLGCDASRTLLWQAAGGACVPVATSDGQPGVEELTQGLAAAETTMAALRARLAHEDVVEIGAPPHLCMALRRAGEVIGVQAASRTEVAPFSAEQRRIAQGIAQIASMALANARLVEELARASRLKTEFVSTMSHELRTPLNVILGFAEMAADARFDGDRTPLIRKIEEAGHQLLELIEGTLEIGRIDAGRTDLLLEPVPLPALWQEVAGRCAILPREPAVTLEWATEVPEIVLVTDARKLTIVVRNLVGNALKFTTRGRVRVAVRCAGGALTVQVADTGIGIPPADHERIFEMFRQGDSSDSRRYGGTGLGLYIVRRFVEQLGGTVAVESTPGDGSVFTVMLPCEPGAPARATAT